jgi:hypothetical protein
MLGHTFRKGFEGMKILKRDPERILGEYEHDLLDEIFVS